MATKSSDDEGQFEEDKPLFAKPEAPAGSGTDLPF